MVQVNQIYTTEQLKKELSITKRSWDTRREELLEYFKLFFDYEIINKGRSRCYKILNVYTDYEPLPKKRKTTEIMAFYKEKTAEIVDKQPLNTGSNIARIIVETDNKYDHAELTATRYVRPVINEEYDKTTRQWCFINYQTQEYEPLTKEQLNYLQECFCSKGASQQELSEEMLYLDAFLNNEIGYNEIANLLITNKKTAFERAIEKFQSKYDRRPMSVPMLVSKENAIKE